MAFSMPDPLAEEDDVPLVAEINVTPLVDVMLVLLIVFMIAAPMMVGGVPVNLPKASAPHLQQQVTQPIVISLDGTGKLFLDKQEIAPDDLAAKLAPTQQQAPDTPVYLRADGSVPYARVMELMGRISSSGFTRVSLLAQDAPVPSLPGMPAAAAAPTGTTSTGTTSTGTTPTGTTPTGTTPAGAAPAAAARAAPAAPAAGPAAGAAGTR